jgi:hypothetical protein
MIKELKDLKPTVDVLEPGKMKASRGGAVMYIFPLCWNRPIIGDPTQGLTNSGGPNSGGGINDVCVCACDPGHVCGIIPGTTYPM